MVRLVGVARGSPGQDWPPGVGGRLQELEAGVGLRDFEPGWGITSRSPDPEMMTMNPVGLSARKQTNYWLTDPYSTPPPVPHCVCPTPVKVIYRPRMQIQTAIRAYIPS